MDAFSPPLVSGSNAPRHAFGYVDNVEPQILYEAGHVMSNIPTGRDDKGFGDCSSRDHEIAVILYGQLAVFGCGFL